jgi:hypothetical protein
MIEVALWLLISVSSGYYNRGNVTVVEKFYTQLECEKVKVFTKSLNRDSDLGCVQAKTAALK